MIKKTLLILLVIMFSLALPVVSHAKHKGHKDKLLICHFKSYKKKPVKVKLKWVKSKHLEKHFRHGDVLANEDGTCNVPDGGEGDEDDGDDGDDGGGLPPLF